jgi:ribosome-binding protein aMBF1 (putative translation factor)
MNDGEVDHLRYAWSNRSVGARIGVDHTVVARYLHGKRYPSLKVMRQIEREYGWPLEEQIRLIPDFGKDPAYGDRLRWILGPQ